MPLASKGYKETRTARRAGFRSIGWLMLLVCQDDITILRTEGLVESLHAPMPLPKRREKI